MRFTANPLVLAVALGLLGPVVLEDDGDAAGAEARGALDPTPEDLDEVAGAGDAPYDASPSGAPAADAGQ